MHDIRYGAAGCRPKIFMLKPHSCGNIHNTGADIWASQSEQFWLDVI